MHWWIIEDALKDRKGHYFEYVRTFKEGLERLGDQTDLFVDRTAERWLIETLGVVPSLPRCIWRRMNDGSPKWKKLLRYPLHGWQTYWALRRILKRRPLPDVIFFPSVYTHHLLGIVPLLHLHSRRSPVKFLLFFPHSPIQFDPASGRAVLRPEPMARLFPLLVKSLNRMVKQDWVILGAETRAMREALESICGTRFEYLPHPVCFDARYQTAVARDGGRVLLGAYGTARHEKGSDLLQEAIHSYLANRPDPNAHFAIQWMDDFRDETGRLLSIDPFLSSHPQVTYIRDYFDPDGGYLRQVAATDIMILPYRGSYRYGLSRVLIESMLAGIPAVVPEETSLWEQATEHGVAVPFKMNSVSSLESAIRSAISQHASLRALACSRAVKAAEHFSVAEFRRRLSALVP